MLTGRNSYVNGLCSLKGRNLVVFIIYMNFTLKRLNNFSKAFWFLTTDSFTIETYSVIGNLQH